MLKVRDSYINSMSIIYMVRYFYMNLKCYLANARLERFLFWTFEIAKNVFNFGFRIIVFFIIIICVSCSTAHNDDDINIELTDFANDLVCAFAETSCVQSAIDSTYSYVFLCDNETVRLFGYSNFSNKRLVGKAMAKEHLVKIYGTESPTIYNRLHKTKEKEKTDTDGNYVEDLRDWEMSMIADSIIIYISECNDRNILVLRDICRKHYPEKVLIWQRTSFRLDDIQL